MMWEIFFLKNHVENETRRLVPDITLFFKKALCKVKASGQHFLIYFGRPRLRHKIKNNSDCSFRDMYRIVTLI